MSESPLITPFLERPPEIRNAIYAALFDTSEPRKLLCTNQGELHCSVGGINLLYTCRATYRETIGFVYGRHPFVGMFGFPNEGGARLLALLQPIRRWLRDIGEKRALMTGLEIDLTGSLVRLHSWIEITPLVRFMFSARECEKVPVTFCVQANNRHVRKLNVAAVNRLLDRLARDKYLKILLRCWRNLNRVVVGGDGKEFKLFFSSTSTKPSAPLEYRLSSDDELIYSSIKPTLNLDGLFSNTNIRDRVFGYLNHSGDRITFDLDHHTVSPPWQELLHVNQTLRTYIRRTFRRTTFWQLVSSKRDYRLDASAAFQTMLELRPDSDNRLGSIIELNVVTEAPTSIYDIRLNATSLVAATATALCSVSVRLDGQPSTDPPTSLVHIKTQLLRLFAHILDLHPQLARLSCPPVYMDGQCRVREADTAVGVICDPRYEERPWDTGARLEQYGQVFRRFERMKDAPAGFDTTLIDCVAHLTASWLHWEEWNGLDEDAAL
ncbi:hypothetical protein C7974DRAFT_387936 [Boeremia exigua]|uniref:uncharacterized protein n=1 Tax=Boeremia exigua TaxID=749465 RepID=UPI001E8E02E4|nr:uncharacterized protein C7974DRAFT_387936 [Boeremia exigua]KAH6639146.1 hypothetical protein C7974DRAFT_387936 [Boeremia exigua]